MSYHKNWEGYCQVSSHIFLISDQSILSVSIITLVLSHASFSRSFNSTATNGNCRTGVIFFSVHQNLMSASSYSGLRRNMRLLEERAGARWLTHIFGPRRRRRHAAALCCSNVFCSLLRGPFHMSSPKKVTKCFNFARYAHENRKISFAFFPR